MAHGVRLVHGEASIFQDYDFDVKYQVGIIKKDANGLSKNPSSSEMDIIGTHWHAKINLEVIHG
jgi:hypothetical protein